MGYVLNPEQVEEIWEGEYKTKIGIPKEIEDIRDEKIKEKLHDIWRFLYVNFGGNLTKGVKASLVRNAIYKYTTELYYKDINGVYGLLNWFQKLNLLELFSKDISEEFVKKKGGVNKDER